MTAMQHTSNASEYGGGSPQAHKRAERVLGGHLQAAQAMASMDMRAILIRHADLAAPTYFQMAAICLVLLGQMSDQWQIVAQDLNFPMPPSPVCAGVVHEQWVA